MPVPLEEMIRRAFAASDAPALEDALRLAANRSAHLCTTANRARLTEWLRKLAEVHYEAESLNLTAELIEKRGYLGALLHVVRAMRNRSNDLAALQGVKAVSRGRQILTAIRTAGTLSHGELAEKVGVSAPSLTQAIRKLRDTGTISCTSHGKFKYYALTPLGTVTAKGLAALPANRRKRKRRPVQDRDTAIAGKVNTSYHGVGGSACHPAGALFFKRMKAYPQTGRVSKYRARSRILRRSRGERRILLARGVPPSRREEE